MLSAISLLLLACALTINAQSACTPSQIGVAPTSHPVKLQPVILQAGVADWRVTIPTLSDCTESGVVAYTCDDDVPPAAHFVDFNTLIVHRNGALQGYATVLVTIYCTV